MYKTQKCIQYTVDMQHNYGIKFSWGGFQRKKFSKGSLSDSRQKDAGKKMLRNIVLLSAGVF